MKISQPVKDASWLAGMLALGLVTLLILSPNGEGADAQAQSPESTAVPGEMAEAIPVFEVEGLTEDGEFLRVRGKMQFASYTSCRPGYTCLHIAGEDLVLAGDAIFHSGFDWGLFP